MEHHEECYFPEFECECERLDQIEEWYRSEPDDLFAREWGSSGRIAP
ncbi:hypothetical protein [Streptomyces sp. NPDC102264]